MNYINTKKIREEFPFFRQNNYIYFDNAATTQKPQIIIDSLVEFYTHKNTNVYRGTSIQAHKTTEEYELSRDTIKNYIDCDKDGEVVWTSGATESINLVASSYLKYFPNGPLKKINNRPKSKHRASSRREETNLSILKNIS